MAPPADRPATNTRRGSIVHGEVVPMSSRTTAAIDAGSPAPRAWCRRLKPVPAALGVLAAILLGIDHDEAVTVGGLVHPRRGGEARGVLGASVQHADERTAVPGSTSAGVWTSARRVRPAT